MRRLRFQTIIAAGLFLLAACSTTDLEDLNTFPPSTNEFSVSSSPNYNAKPLSSARFDKAFSVTFQNPSLPIVGTNTFNCSVGFTEFSQNANLSREAVNANTLRRDRRRLLRQVFRSAFAVQSFRIIEKQGFSGYRLTVDPLFGPGNTDVRGEVVIVDTTRGRLVQNCLTRRSAFPLAAEQFFILFNSLTLPE
ncbi:MAG: hypothetical protein AAGI92_01310 [Pseudomonadota bacterium]